MWGLQPEALKAHRKEIDRLVLERVKEIEAAKKSDAAEAEAAKAAEAEVAEGEEGEEAEKPAAAKADANEREEAASEPTEVAAVQDGAAEGTVAEGGAVQDGAAEDTVAEGGAAEEVHGTTSPARVEAEMTTEEATSTPAEAAPRSEAEAAASAAAEQTAPAEAVAPSPEDTAALMRRVGARVDERFEAWSANGAFLSAVIEELVRVNSPNLLTSSCPTPSLTSARASQNAHFGVDIRKLGLKKAVKELLAHCQAAKAEVAA